MTDFDRHWSTERRHVANLDTNTPTGGAVVWLIWALSIALAAAMGWIGGWVMRGAM